MWPFNKKKIELKEEKKVIPTKTVLYNPQKIDIGRTTIRYTFTDGRKFLSKSYGSFYQYVTEDIPVVWPPSVTNSLVDAQARISNIFDSGSRTIVDDYKNPRKAIVGTVCLAEIVKTETYEEEYQVAYLVDNEKKESSVKESYP